MANTIPANNNTSLYNATGNAVPVGNDIEANNINASGNVTVGGFIVANGSISTNSNFVGNLIGDVTGNITGNINLGPGNTQIIYNDSGVTGSSPAFTFNQASNVMSITGNIVSTGYLFGNGSQLTGLPATYGNANVADYLPTYTGNLAGGNLAISNNISATGNVSGTYFLGNGALLTGLPATYSNANVQAYLPTYNGNLNPAFVSASGNVTAGNLKTSGANGNIVGANYVSANFFVGDGSLLTNLPAGILGGNMTSNISGNGFAINNVTSLTSTGIISAAGNVSGNFFIGDGSQLTGISGTYSNANVQSYMANFGSNTITTTGNVATGNIAATGAISATGNVSGNFIIGDGSQLTNLPVQPGTYSNANVQAYLPTYTGNLSGGNLVLTANTGNAYVHDLTATGSAYITGVVSAAGNVRGGNINTTGLITATGNITGGNLHTAGEVTATGNITGNYFIGNGSQLTGIVTNYSNANVANYLPIYSGNIGTLNSSNLQINGDVVNIHATNATSTVNGISLNTPNGGSFVAMETPKVYIAEPPGGGGTQLQVAGNISTTPGNVLVTGLVSATGNITGNYFIGNGSQLTGLPSQYSNANVSSFLAVYGSNTISSTGNITTTANIAGGNLLTTGIVSATGNITGNYFIGNGSQLTGLPAGYSNADVNAHLAAFGSNTISTTGNITAGYFVGNGSELTNITGANVTGTVGSANTTNLVNVINTGGAGAGTYYLAMASATGNTAIEIDNVANSLVYFPSTATLQTNILSAVGNVTGGNVLTAGVVSATGNITGNFFIGNGSQLTGITANYSNTNVQSYLASFGSNTISTTGNISAGFFLGDGSQLTNLPAGNYSNANVSAYLAAFGSNTISTTGTVTAGNITGGNILTGGIISATGTITAGAVTYANTDGTVGQVLTTYGNGVTYFSTVSGGGGGGANIANGTSNVNIATANGNVTFGVAGTSNVIVVDSGNVYTGNIRGPSASTGVQIYNYKDRVFNFGNATGTITPDPANGSIQNLTLTGNITLNAFGGTPQAGQSMTLICKQDATGNRLLTSTMLWAGNTKTLSTAANAVDMIFTFYDGTNYYASLSRGFV